ncbi:hypothetical protein WA026_013811 [Henosepilachna vigintioctopunctata]|uniref:RRM domain-containing protein n=1 Tax=Henosepilachna vigintioctopunctata TaxID=420089 RepID=A0AAW1US21_9CUCU
MPPKIKRFRYPMKIDEITGQRIITSTKEADENSLNTELFVKNVPHDATEDELIPFFEQVGPLQTLRLMMNEKRTENRGYAYLTYLRNKDSKMAISLLHGKEIRQFKPISVELSLNNCRIFIGGIPIYKTKDQVWQELIKQGVQDIVDVIMYRSYNNRAENRGFVFVEFPSHKLAAKMRNRHKDLILWGNKVIVDWSVPQPEIPVEVMSQVRIIYLRNLSVMESREELKRVIEQFVDSREIEKLYKFKNYAFVHLSSRKIAEDLRTHLQVYYKHTKVEVAFAKPPNNYTQPEYRRCQMSKSNAIPINQQSSETFTTTSSSHKPSLMSEYNKSSQNINNPIFSFTNPYSFHNHHNIASVPPSIPSMTPFISHNYPNTGYLNADTFTNYYNPNFLNNQSLMERVVMRSPTSQEYLWYGDSVRKPRSRNDSSVSINLKKLLSTILRYH